MCLCFYKGLDFGYTQPYLFSVKWHIADYHLHRLKALIDFEKEPVEVAGIDPKDMSQDQLG